MRKTIALALMLLILSAVPVSASQTGEDAYAEWAKQDYCEYFEQTDKYLCFGFRSYWNEFGGLEIFGYPITNEIIEDGMTVQYFERARFEWHPGVWPERHDVLQGRLGAEITASRSGEGPFAPVDARDGCDFYSQTGHNVCDNFLDRWEMSGGLPVFGYPISEAFEEDGMTVQYFERQRMEHQPGVWPERHDVLLGRLGAEIWAGEEPGEPGEPQPQLRVVADNLVQPRDLLATPHGLYITEAGNGAGVIGQEPCITMGSGVEGCVGRSGALTLVDDDGQRRVVDEISSILEETGEGIGVHDVAMDDEGNLYIVVGVGADPTQLVELGSQGAELGKVLRVDEDGSIHFVADIAMHEELENPDGSVIDTNPFGMAWDGENLIVADAGGNSLLRVGLDSSVETIAIFEERLVPAPPFIPEDEVPMHAVPTNVAVGPDGNYYVTQLTGFPFPVGGANIYQVTPEGDVSVHAEGFTNLGDLAFDADGNLWAIELVAGGLLNADPEDPSTLASRLIKIAPDGTQTDYMFQGMAFATSIAIGAEGEIYVSNLAVTPMAHVLRIDLP